MTVYSQSAAVLADLRPGQALLEGMMPDLAARVAAVPMNPADKPVQPTPEVPYPFDLVLRMCLAQRLVRGQASEPIQVLLVQSAQLGLSWDRVVLRVHPDLAQAYRFRAVGSAAAFEHLFRTPRQTYYVAHEGRIGPVRFRGLWVVRDIDTASREVVLNVYPVPVDAAAGDLSYLDTAPALTVPRAASWDEAVAKASIITAHIHREQLGVQDSATVMQRSRGVLGEWEPIVALIADMLDTEGAVVVDDLSSRVLRDDAGVGVLDFSLDSSKRITISAMGEPTWKAPR